MLSYFAHPEQKPAMGALKLDPGHPLALGLTSAWLLNDHGQQGALWDYAGKWPATRSESEPFGWESTRYGSAIRAEGGANCAGITPTTIPLGPLCTMAVLIQAGTISSKEYFIGVEVLPSGVRVFLRYGDVGSNKIDFVWSGVGAGENKLTSATGVTTGQYYHVVAVYDGAGMRLYMNGVLDASNSSTSSISSTTNPIAIGASTDGSSVPALIALNAPLIYAFLWQRALSAGEVKAHYADPYGMFQTRPMQRWSVIVAGGAAQDTPELYGRPDGLSGQRAMTQILVQ